MSAGWPPLTYGSWSATCDTLHAHTQVLGKLESAERRITLDDRLAGGAES